MLNHIIIVSGKFFPAVLAGNAFSLKGVIVATAVVALTGLLIGLFLGFASTKFEMKVDETESSVRELLPSNNCGGCGYPGCDGLAKAIVKGEAPVNACVVANQAVHDKIAKLLGKASVADEKKTAFVKCTGTCDKTQVKYDYFGNKDCKNAADVPGRGNKKCSFGCIGFGSCVKACVFDAIHIVDGVALVHKEKCTGCGQCAAQCPNHLIDLVPDKSRHMVGCSSNDKGKDVKAACLAGCIGCKLCEKNCEYGAVTVDNNLAHIDYGKCTNCGKCAAVCPVKVIRIIKEKTA